jgi:hypothetical protein
MPIWIYKSLFLISILCFPITVFSKSQNVLIAYSKSSLDMNPIYSTVIKGVEKNLSTEILELNDDELDYQQKLDKIHPDRIIALGKQVVKSIDNTTYVDKMIAGIMFFDPSNYRGVSLIIDHSVIEQQVTALLPEIQKIYVIQQENNQSIYSRENSKRLEFKDYPDLLDAIRASSNMIEKSDSTVAIVLPPNTAPNIVFGLAKLAWDRNVVLISTNLSHLDVGVMMVLFPDAEATGEELASLAKLINPKGQYTKNIKIALNSRVAQHLSKEFTQKQKDKFSITVK